jgi:hypothetical protein
MRVENVLTKFFASPPDGITDTPALRAALVETYNNVKLMTNATRAPVGPLRTYPVAFAHKIMTAAQSLVATLPPSPTAEELAAVRESLYATCVRYLHENTTPLFVDMDKPTLKAELDKLVAHARAFNPLTIAPPSIVMLLGTSALVRLAVRGLFVAIDKENLPALRAACETIRAARGVAESTAPPRKPTEIQDPSDTEGGLI